MVYKKLEKLKMDSNDYQYWYSNKRINAKTQIYNYEETQESILSKIVSNWTSAPSSTPSYLWQIYIKTDTAKVYISTGTTNSSDWTIIN